MPAGRKFITHEFDEAIAIQRAIVDSEKALSSSHPMGKVKRRLKADLRVDRRHLDKLEAFGHAFDATGKREGSPKHWPAWRTRRQGRPATPPARRTRPMRSSSP
jgi:hypothetical protein